MEQLIHRPILFFSYKTGDAEGKKEAEKVKAELDAIHGPMCFVLPDSIKIDHVAGQNLDKKFWPSVSSFGMPQ